MNRKKQDLEKLQLWQARYSEANNAYQAEKNRMDEREKIYRGDRNIRTLVAHDTRDDGGARTTPHVRNIVAENIESQVSSYLPPPKVTPRRQKDEKLAALIEHWLRNEMDRLNFEEMNDLAERVVPVQGGGHFMVGWDNQRRTHNTVGDVYVRFIHTKQVVPQDGVYTGIEDMDWIFVDLPQTKTYIRRRYGVDVDAQSESDPDVKGIDAAADTARDMVTQHVALYRNENGGIGRYSWVNNITLEDMDDYQARRLRKCSSCGAVEPLPGQKILYDPGDDLANEVPWLMPEMEQEARDSAALAEYLAGAMEPGVPLAGAAALAKSLEPREYSGDGTCPYCGVGRFTDEELENEFIYTPIRTQLGKEIPGVVPGRDENGEPALVPTVIPFYKPDIYPLVLQKSVSLYGQYLGDSDVDKIRDQQNTTNRIEAKIIDRILKAGTRVTLPDRADLRLDPKDGEIWYIGNAGDKAMIDVYEFKGDLQYEMLYLSQVYEESRQEIGITDSFQGRKDTTATSGKAKEFSAMQAAGRLDSKKAMKNAAYAKIFELMFKTWLAYADEPRKIIYRDNEGKRQYAELSRYDFLEQDEAGQWYYNDQFLFSVDDAAPLSANREALWQELRMNLQSGALGDPTSTETLVLFWTQMEQAHYPLAGTMREHFEQRLERENEAAMAQAPANWSAVNTQQQTPMEAVNPGLGDIRMGQRENPQI